MAALQAIELARRGKPVSSDFELLLAATHWKRGDLAGAESGLDGILNTNPADVDAWCLMGEVLYGLDRIEESRTAFERALDLDPECRWAADQLGGTDGQNLRLRSAEKKIPKKS